DMTDQAILLGFADQGLMDKLWQLHASELGEGARECGFVRNLPSFRPSADASQLRVSGQRLEQLSGESESVHGLGDERTGDSQPVLGRPTDPTPARRNDAGQWDHRQGCYQALG